MVADRPLCDIEWSELHARKLSSGDVNSVQHRVIAVAVNARGRDQRQALGQFQGRMPQLGAPIGLRLVEAMDERIVGHLFEALQRPAARNSAAALVGDRLAHSNKIPLILPIV
jgi:hypothetical protein